MKFDGTEKLIGKGAQADVLLYQGYAYKVYRPSYPSEWIAFEKRQQAAVNQAGLCPVRYYDTDDDHIIKMDLVSGQALEKYVLDGFVEGFDLLGEVFSFVHSKDITGIDIPPYIATVPLLVSEEKCPEVIPVIERLSAKMAPCICHLDMHFLNIMLPPDKSTYTIIDWMNARIAPPVFDYARTYVIFDEFSKEGLAVYNERVLKPFLLTGISDEDFADAVKVSQAVRDREKQ